MMRYKIILFCLIIPLVSCYKEINTVLLDGTFLEIEIDSMYYYEYIPEVSKRIVYSEDFNDANSDWWTGVEGDLKAEIQFGNYKFSNNDDSKLRWLTSQISIDPDKDFELEAQIMNPFSSDDDGGGIGLKDIDGNLLNFIIDDINNVSVNQWDDATEKFTRTLDWEEKHWIETFYGTLLTIRKIEGQYIFFADKKYIGLALEANQLTPDRFTLFLKGDVRLEIDYLTLSYIE